MDLKVGDKVKIRNDLTPGRSYGGIYFAQPMTKHFDKIVTILIVENYREYQVFRIKEDSPWTFTNEMTKPRLIFGR